MPKKDIIFLWEPDKKLKKYIVSGLSDTLNPVFPEIWQTEPGKWFPVALAIVGWRPKPEYLQMAEKLILFQSPGAGIQHLIKLIRETNEIRKNKAPVILCNCHGNAKFTAQHGIALLFGLLNKIIPHHNQMCAGKWRLGDDFARSEPIEGKRIGFYGYGAVNQAVHNFLRGFDLKFSAFRKRTTETEEIPVYTTETMKIADFFALNDIIFTAVPQTPATENSVGSTELEALGRQGLLINIARGEVVIEEALFSALQQKKIAGAGIDVWYDYKPEPDEMNRLFPFHFPFQKLDNVILSPHRAASPFDDQSRWNPVIENLNELAKGNYSFKNIVNIDSGY